MKNKKKIFILLIGLFIMSLIIMTTYAYFSAIINGNSSSNNVEVNMKDLSLLFSDETDEVSVENMSPGWTYEKTVTVTNNGENSITYDLVWLNLTNEFIKNELVYEIECTSNCNGLVESPITNISGTGRNLKIVTNTIDSQEVQTYKVTLTFKEVESNQNYNANKTFSGNLGILQTGTYDEIYIGNLLDTDWEYSISGDKITLTKYIGTNTDVEVYPYYDVDGTTYQTVLNASYTGPFKKNTQITSVKFIDNVEFLNNTMQFLFNGCTSLKEVDVSKLDTSSITSMTQMFWGTSSLTTLDLSSFNTSKVTTMTHMFRGCSALTNLDLSSFDTSKVTSMYNMFGECKALTSLDLSSFNTKNVKDMSCMFSGCSALTSLNLSNFNTSNVTNMVYMFSGCSSLTSLDLSSFNTSSVTTMASMFQRCSALTSLDVTNFDTSNVTNMSYMFYVCRALTSLDLSSFNTSSVTTMANMFYGCRALTSLDLTSFDTSNVTNMQSMFHSCTNLIEIKVKQTFVIPSSNNNMFYSCGTQQLTYVE